MLRSVTMKQNFKILIATACLLIAYSTAAGAATWKSPIWLDGRVLSQNLSPLPDAWASAGEESVTTDKNGMFSLGPLYGDFARLTISAEGYKTDITDIPLSNIRGPFEVVLFRDSGDMNEGDRLLSAVPTRARTATETLHEEVTHSPYSEDAVVCSLPPVPSLGGPSGLINIPTAQGLKNRQHAVGIHLGRHTTSAAETDSSIYKAAVGLSDQIEVGAAFYEQKPVTVGSKRQSKTSMHIKYSGKTQIENVSYCMGAQAAPGDSNVFMGATLDAKEALGSIVLKDNPDAKQPTFNFGLEVPLDPSHKLENLAGHSVILELEEGQSTSRLDQYTMGWRYRSRNKGNLDLYHSRNYTNRDDYTTGLGGSITF